MRECSGPNESLIRLARSASRPRCRGLALAVLFVFSSVEPAGADIYADPASFPSLSGESPLTKGFWESNGGSGYTIQVGLADMAPVHAALVPPTSSSALEGKVVFFETFESGGAFFLYDLDATGGAPAKIEAINAAPQWFQQDYFCSGHSVLPNGDLLVVGGHWGRHISTNSSPPPSDACRYIPADPWVGHLDVSAGTYKLISPLPGKAQYYPTCTPLANGDVLVWGGEYWIDANGDSLIGPLSSPNCPTDPDDEIKLNHEWMEFHMEGDDPSHGTWEQVTNPLSGEILNRVQTYPYTQVIPAAPNGNANLAAGGLLWVGPHWQGGAGTDSSSRFISYAAGQPIVQDSRKLLRRGGCAMVLLGLDMPNPVPRVLLVGGGDQSLGIVTPKAEIWDASLASSRWVEISPMAEPRHDPNAVLLPNGDAFVVGGHKCPCSPSEIPIYVCETFTPGPAPTYGAWAESDALAKSRQYHSVALLLPDGRVVCGGGEPRSNPGQNTYEVYYPPYLFKQSGPNVVPRDDNGDRPRITAIQEHGLQTSREIYYGHGFTVSVGDINLNNAFKVVMMKPSSVTHSNDMNQRRIVLEAAASQILPGPGFGGTIAVTASFQADDAPPGPYMVFVLDSAGIPSKARWVFLKTGTPVPAPSNVIWNTTLTQATNFTVDPGETLFVDTGAQVSFGANVELAVLGVMKVRAATAGARFKGTAGGTSHWKGVRVAPTGKLVADNTNGLKIENAKAAILWQQMTFPDVSHLDQRLDFLDNFTHMSFDRDVVVASGDSATIPSGWTLGFGPGDASASGRHPARSELIVPGKVHADGTAGRIIMKSADPSPQPWFGVRFIDAIDNRLSTLKSIDFDRATYAVSLDSLTGNLFDLQFTNSDSGAVFVDRDTRLPLGYEINLIATAASACDFVINAIDPAISTHWGEDSSRVEVIVEGAFRVRGTSGRRLVFRPNAQDDVGCDDWHGITIRGDDIPGMGIADIDSVEISHATYPLTFFIAETAVVKRSLFHNYRHEAITDFFSDALVSENKIYPGPGTDPIDSLFWRVGIHIAESHGVYEKNEIFHNPERGIWADFSSGYCTSTAPPVSNKTLTIRDNHVIGMNWMGGANAAGIEVSWACREHDVDILRNNVQGWPDVGIKLRNSSDVEIECNCSKSNKIGLQHNRKLLDYRYDTYKDGYSVLRDNLLKNNEDFNARTLGYGPIHEPDYPSGPEINTSGIYGGGYTHPDAAQGSAGANLLQVAVSIDKNWRLEAVETRTDIVRGNAWKDETGAVLADSASVNVYNQKDLANQVIDSSAPLAQAPQNCVANEGSACPIKNPPAGEQTAPRRLEADAPDVHGDSQADTPSAQERLEIPTQFRLHPPRPNPASKGVTLQLDVPAADASRAEVGVYDVTGRRVTTLFRGEALPGRHFYSWDLTDQAGMRTASGIYFARVVAGVKVATQRIVVLQ